MDNNTNLKSLVEAYCSQSSETPEKKLITYRLLQAVQSLPNLSRVYQKQKNSYAQDFEEILNDTLLKIVQNICEDFKPKDDDYIKSITKWINLKLRLYYEPKDKQRKNNRHKLLELDRYINSTNDNTTFIDLIEANPDEVTLNSIDGLIEQAQKSRRKRFGLSVWKYLEQDPDHKLKKCCSKKYPDCTCYLLVKKKTT